MTRPTALAFALCPGLCLALAACGDGAAPVANTAVANIAAPVPEEGYAQRIRELPERQRAGVFLRAIRDGKEQCQAVTDKYEIAAVQARPAWAATCDRSVPWVIAIDASGTAIVTKASQASRLPPLGS